MKLKNNGTAIIALGSINLIPGAPGAEVGKEWINHPEVKAWIKAGTLESTEEETVIEGSEGNKVPLDGMPEDVELENMTLIQLKEYAEKTGIDIGSASKKEDILATIQKAINDFNNEQAGA